MFFHFKVGNTVAQKTACSIALLEHIDLMASADQLLSASKPRRPRTDNSDFFARLRRRWLRHNPALLPAAINNLALDCLNGDGIAVDVERAGFLAGRRAYATGEFGEIVGRMEKLERGLPIVAIDEIVPVGDEVVDRANAVTIGNAT